MLAPDQDCPIALAALVHDRGKWLCRSIICREPTTARSETPAAAATTTTVAAAAATTTTTVAAAA